MTRGQINDELQKLTFGGLISRRDLINSLVKISEFGGMKGKIALSESLSHDRPREEKEREELQVLNLFGQSLSEKEIFDILAQRKESLLEFYMGMCKKVRFPLLFKNLSLCVNTRKMDLGSSQLGDDACAAFSGFLRQSSSLEVLELYGCTFENTNQVLEALGETKLVELVLEKTGLKTIENDQVLARSIAKCRTLKSLNISQNKGFVGTNTFQALTDSNVEKVESRAILSLVINPEDLVLLMGHQLVTLDLRDYHPNGMGKAIEALRGKNCRLYCLWVGPISGDLVKAMMDALRDNQSLGKVLLFYIYLCLPFLGVLQLESQHGFHPQIPENEIPGNFSLFSLVPYPEEGTPLRRQLENNRNAAVHCRLAILTILTARKYHREECGEFFGNLPKEIVLLICKAVWKTRREKVWSDKKFSTRGGLWAGLVWYGE